MAEENIGTDTDVKTSGYNNVFNKIEKFSGRGDRDFASWLRTFDRACIIGQKSDDLVKGQLLMLCLTGQAIAVAEQLEEEKKTPQKYSELKTRLESVFNTTASREAKMVEFENRIQRLEESEDEFMLSLVKLYKAANPDAQDAGMTLAIKRKFMHGISAELRRSTYIFCQEPYAETVSYQTLLEHTRKARLQLMEEKSSHSILSNPISSLSECSAVNSNTMVMQAISNMEKNFNERIDALEKRHDDQRADVNSIDGRSYFSSNYRGSNRGGNRGSNHRSNSRGNFRGNSRGNNRGNSQGARGNRNSFTCYNCGGFNHIARNCNSSKN